MSPFSPFVSEGLLNVSQCKNAVRDIVLPFGTTALHSSFKNNILRMYFQRQNVSNHFLKPARPVLQPFSLFSPLKKAVIMILILQMEMRKLRNTEKPPPIFSAHICKHSRRCFLSQVDLTLSRVHTA